MPTGDIHLSAVLGVEPLPDGSPLSAESQARVRAVVDELVAGFPLLRPWHVGPGVLAEFIRALRSPLGEVAAAAWNKRDEIRKFADPEQTPPDETNEVWLYEHELEQTFTPAVRVKIAGVPVARLALTAKATLRFEGAMLVIRGGRITHVRLGDLSASSSISAGKATVFEHEIVKWSLPDRLRLGDGVPIPPRKVPAAAT